MNEKQILVEAIYSSSRKACLRLGLVLEAAGIPYQMLRKSGKFILIVPANLAAQARAEINIYSQENQASPSEPITITEQGSGWPGVIGYVVVLLIIFFIQHLDENWLHVGKTHAGLILQGDWWRTVTALTLHNDALHLAANIATGSLIGLYAGKLLGSGFAWFSILIAGALGNLLNAWVRDPSHTSIGASTAVFATFGLVAAFATIRRRHIRRTKFARYTPIIGAVILLSYLGTSGERTDVFAHVAGFIAGLLLGALYGKLGDKITLGKRAQLLFGIAAIATVGLSWMIALTRYAID